MNPVRKTNYQQMNLTNTYNTVLNGYQTQHNNTSIVNNQQQVHMFQRNNVDHYYNTNAVQYQNQNVNLGLGQQQFAQQPQIQQGQQHYQVARNNQLNTNGLSFML